MTFGAGVVMMGSPGGGFRNPKQLGQVTQSLYVYLDDPHENQACATGVARPGPGIAR